MKFSLIFLFIFSLIAVSFAFGVVVPSVHSQAAANFTYFSTPPPSSFPLLSISPSDVSLRSFIIQGQNAQNVALSNNAFGQFFSVDMFTSNPSCYPNATYPDCFPSCAPANSPACLSYLSTAPSLASSSPSYVSATQSSALVDLGNGRWNVTLNPQYKGQYDIETSLLTQGGLNAAYYDNVWFVSPASVVRVDSVVSFNWSTGAITPFGVDYVAIRWKGKLKPTFSETYKITVNADDWFRVWIDKRLVAQSWGGQCCVTSWGFVKLDNSFFHDIIIEYVELTGSAAISLQWSSPSTPLSVIPSSNLYSLSPIVGSPVKNITVKSADPPSAQYSFVTDSSPLLSQSGGLSNGIVGVTSSFVFSARDKYGAVADGPSQYSNVPFVAISGPDSASTTAVTASQTTTWVGAGNYIVTYTPTRAGRYTIQVSTNTQGGVTTPLSTNSSFTVTVSPAPTNATFCTASVSGTVWATANIAYSFIIYSRDSYGNLRNTSSSSSSSTDSIVVELQNNATGALVGGGAAYNRGLGIWTATFTASVSGSYSAFVRINGNPIGGLSSVNPTFNVIVGSGALYPLYSTVSINGGFTQLVAGTSYSLNILALDSGKNNISSPTYPFTMVGQSSPLNSYADFSSSNSLSLGGAAYSLSFTPTMTGNFFLSVFNASSVSSPLPSSSALLSGATIPVTVVSGAPSSLTSAFLTAPSANGQVGISMNFRISVKDAFGNVLNNPSYVSSVSAYGVSSTCNASSVVFTPSSNGIFNGTFTPQTVNKFCQFNVTINGVTATALTTMISVLSGPAVVSSSKIWGFSSVSTASSLSSLSNMFTIQSFDGSLNAISIKGAQFQVKFTSQTTPSKSFTSVASSSSSSVSSVYGASQITDLNNGNYTVKWSSPLSDTFTVTVSLTSPGGLLGKYYSDPNFQISSAQQVDSQIQFDWQYGLPLVGFPTSTYFSVEWTGFLVSPTTAQYVLYIDTLSASGVYLSVGGVVLLDKLNYLSSSSSYSTSSLLLNSSLSYAVSLKFIATTGPNGISFSWSAPYIFTKTPIPSTALSYSLNYANPLNVSVGPSPPSSVTSVFQCSPLNDGTPNEIESNDLITCVLQLIDDFGNYWTTANSAISINGTMSKISGTAITQYAQQVNYIGNGQYSLTFRPTQLGQYVLSISINGVAVSSSSSVPSSSTVLTVVNGDVSPTLCTVSGVPTPTWKVTAGDSQTFFLNVIDVGGQSINKDITLSANGNSEFDLFVGTSPSTSVLDITSIMYKSNGQYSVTFTPTVSGVFSLYLYLNSISISQSPYNITVSPSLPSSVSTHLFPSSASLSNISVNHFASLATLRTVDSFGNSVDFGGSLFSFQLANLSNPSQIYSAEITDFSNGTYVISTFIPSPGGKFQGKIYMCQGNQTTQWGLTGNYYNNRWAQSPAALTRIDGGNSSAPTSGVINFNWGANGLITPTARSYVSVVWTGFLLIEVGQNVTFQVKVDDGVKLEINGITLIDQLNANTGNSVFTASYDFTSPYGLEDQLFPIKVTYRQNIDSAFIQVNWNYGMNGAMVFSPIPSNATCPSVGQVDILGSSIFYAL